MRNTFRNCPASLQSLPFIACCASAQAAIRRWRVFDAWHLQSDERPALNVIKKSRDI
jgi:hypothetical protein